MNERSQACAACKHQRRKCHKNCLLAPYFPSGEHEDFMNAHKLFGVSNITKILNQIEPDQRSEAIKSILIESKARRDDPVKGIVGIIQKLRSEIQVCEAELNMVKQQLAYNQQLIYRQQQKEHIIEQLQSQQQLLGFLASSSSTTSSPLLQMPALLDSANNNKPYAESDTLNQGCTYSTTKEYGNHVKPLDDKTTSQRKKAHIKFKDAGRIQSAEPVNKGKQLAN